VSELLKQGRTRSKAELFRDTRPTTTKIYLFLQKEGAVAPAILAFALTLFLPAMGLALFILALLFTLPAILYRPKYPLIAPMSETKWDYTTPPLGKTKGRSKAKGITYLGFDVISRMPVYSNNDLDRQHKFLLMTTGGGKTVTITSVDIAASALVQLSGFLMVDGKATLDAFYSIYGIMRRFGREQDLLLINFMKGERDFRIKGVETVTNSFNFLAYGTSSQISELLKSLLGDSGASGGDDVWKKRAESYIEAETQIFCYLRDQGELKFTVESYRKYLGLAEVIQLTFGNLGDDKTVDIPDDVTMSMRTFLNTVAGLDATIINEVANGITDNLTETANEQFGFISMQIAPMLNILATDYAHIFNHADAEVDLKDIVLNRRGLLVLLPSLEYGTSTLGNLGKIVVTGVKSMMAMQLGSEIEGDPRVLLAKRAFAAPSAFKVIYDELVNYLCDGMDLSASQGRGLGISFTFSTQELGTMKNKDAGITSAVWGSTNIKQIGKLEDADTSLEMIAKRLGEASFTTLSGYSVDWNNGGANPKIRDSGQVNVEKRAEADIKDLAKQREGESYLIYGDRVIKIVNFFVDDKQYTAKQTRMNQFVSISRPSKEVVASLKGENINVIKNAVRKIMKGEVDFPESIKIASSSSVDTSINKDYLISKDNGAGIEDRARIAIYSVHDGVKSSQSTVQNKAVEMANKFKGQSQNSASRLEDKAASAIEGAQKRIGIPPSADNELESVISKQSVVEFEMTSHEDFESEQSAFEYEDREVMGITEAFREVNAAQGVSSDSIQGIQTKTVNDVKRMSSSQDSDVALSIVVGDALEHPKPPVPNDNKEEVIKTFNSFLNAIRV